MRIWHPALIPHLCQKHLCAMWREGLGAYKIITENRTNLSYFKHPATQEFVNDISALWSRLYLVRQEMLKRGYHPKEMPNFLSDDPISKSSTKQWQTLVEQINHLKTKQCQCQLNKLT